MSGSLIAGVDFSGSKEMPNQTWLATGRLNGLGLEMQEVKKVGSHKLAAELNALAGLAAVGLDFPFSLPGDFIRFCSEKAEGKEFQSWQQVAEHLIFMQPDEFDNLVKEFNKDAKRLTDDDYRGLAHSPLHRGKPVMVKMTYEGIRLLAGLNPARFCVLPFHDRKADGCSVVEVFPRGTLWCLGLPDSGYKSKEKKDQTKMQEARKNILTHLLELRERKGAACRDYPRLNMDKQLQHTAIESDDALDAVIACYTTAIWFAVPSLFADPFSCDNEDVLLEGWIYAPLKTREAWVATR